MGPEGTTRVLSALVRTPSGDTMGISIRLKLTVEWVWLDIIPEADRLTKNEGDGTKGRFPRNR